MTTMKTVTRDEWNKFHKDHHILHEEIEINNGLHSSLVRLLRDNKVIGQAYYQRNASPIYQVQNNE